MLGKYRLCAYVLAALILFSAIAPGSLFAGEMIIYAEGFEDNDGGYTVDGSPIWEWGAPIKPSGPLAANSGTKCWGNNGTFAVVETLEGNLYSPAIIIPPLKAGEIARLQFYAYIDVNYEQYGEGDFYISTDGMLTWQLLGRFYEKMAGGWQRYSFNVSDYADQNVHLRFRTYMQSFDPGLYIDDVAITIEDVPSPCKILTLEANEDPAVLASCPWVYSWDGAGFVRDNDIYSVGRYSQGEMRDYYLLQKPLLPQGGLYTVEIREVESEDSWTDLLGLWTVDHLPDVAAAPDNHGDVLTYRPAELVKPVSAVSSAATDVLPLVSTKNNIGYKAYSDNFIDLDFGAVDCSVGSRVLLRMKGFNEGEGEIKPFSGPPAILIQVPDDKGLWQEAGRLNPRFEWSEGMFDLASYLPDPSGHCRIRLTSISHDVKYHEIDLVALAIGLQPAVTVTALPLVSASLGDADVLFPLSTSDDNYVQLSSGNKFSASFSVSPLQPGLIRDFILESEGYYVPKSSTYFIYTWDGVQWLQRDSYSFDAMDSVRTFDLSSYLPDPAGEYKARIWQDYSNYAAAIDYVGLQVGDHSGILGTAKDLRNNSSIISLVQNSDDNRLTYLRDAVKKQPRNRWSEYSWTIPPDIFTLTFTANSNGSLTGNTDQSVISGEDATAVTALPASGYHFVNWTAMGDFVSIENPLIVTHVTAPQTFTANFAPDPVDGVCGSSLGGTFFVAPASNLCQFGTASVLTGSGHPWEWSCVGLYEGIVAHCSATIQTALVTLVAGDHGTLSGVPIQEIDYDSSTTAVTAVPVSGYHFVNWSGSLFRNDNPIILMNVIAEITLTANFAPDPIDGVCGSSYGETFPVGPTSNLCQIGTASALTGSGHPWEWSCAGLYEGIAAGCSATIQTSLVTWTAGAHGTLSGTPSQIIDYNGTTTSVAAIPASGYHFVNWSGSLTRTDNPIILTNVTAAINLTANFAPDPVDGVCGSSLGLTFPVATDSNLCQVGTASALTGSGHPWAWSCAGLYEGIVAHCSATIQTSLVTLVAGDHGTLSGTPLQEIDYDSSTTAVTAVPVSGYHFVNWSGSLPRTDNPLVLTNVTEAINLTANFAPDPVDGVCGSSLGETFSVAPAINLCQVGTASALSGSGHPWAWSCAGLYEGLPASCSADLQTFLVTWSAGANGTLSGTPSQIIDYNGTTTSVAANPASGYHFVNWSGSLTRTDNHLTLTNVTEAISLTANFAPDPIDGVCGSSHGETFPVAPDSNLCQVGMVSALTGSGHPWEWSCAGLYEGIAAGCSADLQTFLVKWSAGDHGTLSGTPSQIIDYNGTTTSVAAVPASGYHFVNWSGSLTRTDNPIILTNVTEAISLTANFTPDPIDGVCGSSLGGTFPVAPDSNLCQVGTVSALTGSGHPWEWSCAGLYEGLPASCSANLQTNSVTFTAGDHGTLSGIPAQNIDYNGTTTSVAAVPFSGYHFVNWSGSLTRTDNPIILMNVTEAITLTANFAPDPVVGICGSSLGGTFPLAPTTDLCQVGTASALSGSGHPWAWSCAGLYEGIAANCSATIQMSLVTLVAGDHGILTGTSSQEIDHGGSTTAVTAVPASGYHFVNWSGSLSRNDNPIILTNVIAAINLTANFAPDPIAGVCGSSHGETFPLAPAGNLCQVGTASALSGSGHPWAWSCAGLYDGLAASCSADLQTFLVTWTAGDHGTLSGTPSQIIDYNGTTTSVAAIPASGYHFVNWSGSLTRTDNPIILMNVTAAINLTANFAPDPVDGVCGSSHGETFPLAPASNLCQVGTVSALTGFGHPWEWSCAGVGGGVEVSCRAELAEVRDVVSPVVTLFTVPADSASLTVEITAFAAIDNTAVTGYLVSNFAGQPQSQDPGWSTTPLTQYLFPAQGVKTLFAFAKDAAGNISSGVSAKTTIALPSIVYGDLNNDGETAVSDALLALLMATGKKTIDLKADIAPLVNGLPSPDGKVSAADALVILRRAVGLW